MPNAIRSSIAQEYEVPKKPLFVADEKLWLSQSSDLNTYVSDSLSENILSVTNGNISLRCKTETETAEIENEVMLTGAYHQARRGTSMVDVGAVPCFVNIDMLIDGVSGTLSHSPHSRLSLKDGTFHRQCGGIMNSDGNLVFDCDYYHTVSTTDPSLWSAEITYHNFRGMFSAADSTVSTSLNDDSIPEVPIGNASDHFPETFMMECVVTFIVHKQDWSIVRLRQLDHVVQRSMSSSCAISSSIEAECFLEGGTQPGRVPDAPIAVIPGERRHRRSLATRGDLLSVAAAGSAGPGGAGASAVPGDEAQEFGDTLNFVPGQRDPPPGGFDNSEEESKVFEVKKCFTFMYDEVCPLTRIVLRLSACHVLGSEISIPRPLPTLRDMKEATRRDFNAFLAASEVNMEIEDEPRERTQLALRYNSLRLYFLSRGLRRGIPSRVCGTGDGMLFDLGHYIYYGLYFTLTQPDAALQLLLSLFDMLDKARENARECAVELGAIYPLRTIEGAECMNASGNTCFVHVNAEIGNLIYIYFLVAPDELPTETRLQLLEMQLEMCRIWLELGQWMEESQNFIIRSTMGADMYNKSTFSNFYVTLSAKKHMERTVATFLQQEKILGSHVVDELLAKIHMSRDELAAIDMACKSILLESSSQYHGVFPVHGTFDTLHPWEGSRAKHPLYLNYHPLAVYRRKVVDIPDVLLGMLLYSGCFERNDYKANIEHYLSLCTFDSPEALGIVAMSHCRAYRNLSKPMYFYRVLSHLNLDNIMYCSEEGLNYVSMTGSLLILILGLGGVTVSTGTLHIDPIISAGLSFYSFCISWKGSRLRLSLNSDTITYELVSGHSMRFLHGPTGHRIHLHTGFRSFQASTKVSIPRITFRQEGVFEGAIVLLESIVHNILEYHYVSWHRTLERLFDTYRTLHNITIPPLNPEEFIDKIVYSKDGKTAFAGINKVLRRRNIQLELGTPEDAEIVDTLYGLGNSNLAEIKELFLQQPPTLNPDLIRLLENLSEREVPLAVVSYTRHVDLLFSLFPVLSKIFITSIDGDEVLDAKLRGQPHVDIFLRAAKKIHVHPSRCLVFGYQLDRGYDVNDLASFFMFLDIEDPFVCTRVAPLPYPLLSPEGVREHKRENPLICRLSLNAIPKNIDELEDAIQGENKSSQSQGSK